MSAIDDSFTNYSIVIPIEFFDLPTVAADTCVKFAIYLGDYVRTRDGDGKKAGIAGGDCNDHDPTIPTGRGRDLGDGKDNNCDGLADEDGSDGRRPTAATLRRRRPHARAGRLRRHERDGPQGRAGDLRRRPRQRLRRRRRPHRRRDGQRDRVQPVRRATADIPLDPLSFDRRGAAGDRVHGRHDRQRRRAHLVAGPSTVQRQRSRSPNGITLDLKITRRDDQGGRQCRRATSMQNGHLGGVIDAQHRRHDPRPQRRRRSA